MSGAESETVRIGIDELERLCFDALVGAGAAQGPAASVARATAAAERRGRSAVGAAHLVDYLDALRAGRLRGDPQVRVTRPRHALLRVDADDGPAQYAIDEAFDTAVAAAQSAGALVLGVGRSFTAGELGWITRRFAEAGLVALATCSSPPLMALPGATRSVTGTNPIAFAVPSEHGVRDFDQAASSTAWVRIRAAAAAGERLPPGCAIDAEGRPTEDPGKALEGALLPNGGVKGANLALMSELLAVLAGGLFCLDSPPFDRGSAPPRVGVFVLLVDPTAMTSGFGADVADHLQRLAAEEGVELLRDRSLLSVVDADAAVVARLRAAARS